MLSTATHLSYLIYPLAVRKPSLLDAAQMTQRSPPPLDDWNLLTLDAVEEVFTDAPFRWWVSGGLALELHVGRSWRSHEDLDIGVLGTEADKVYSWLANWDLWVAAGGTLRPWRGEALEPRQGENNVWASHYSSSSWRFDLAVSDGNDTEWVYRRDRKVRREWDAAVLRTGDGVPYLAPEIQLLFKSRKPRPKDDTDARQVIPMLDPSQRTFLLDQLDDGHQWMLISS